MDDQRQSDADFSKYTEAELLQALYRVHPRRHREDFARLKAALEARGYQVTVSDFGWGTAASGPTAARRSFHAPVEFGSARGAVAWMEPARNDYRLVGSGSISVDNAVVHVTGRRYVLILGLPLQQTVELDRELILNVEVEGNSMRFEYRARAAKPRALTLRCKDSASVERLRGVLPSERTSDFQPRLPAEVEFDRNILARAPRVPVTVAFVAFNLLLFVATVLDGAGLFVSTGNVQIGWGSNFGPYTTDGEWWRLLSSTFIHFGVLHVAFNMWFLAATGPLVERLYGSVAYLLIYLVAGVAASLASISWHPAINSAGASGAIFGIYGALLAALIRGGASIPRSVTKPLKHSTLIFTLYALVAGYLLAGVDNAAHVGGLLTGFGLGLILARRLNIAETRPSAVSTFGPAVLLSAGVLGAGAALAAHASTALHGEALFWQTAHWIERNQRGAVSRWLTLYRLRQEKKLDGPAFAAAVESQVLPVWQDAEQRLVKVRLSEASAVMPRLQYLSRFVASRKAAYELCAQGARTHDAELMEKCSRELARSDAIARARWQDPMP